ncbi:hypothetical protein EMPS_02142 [Entomortierella parvispora]|uniref:RNI-like protein n=1 Tax=Entomortierella parvispora TaxID=205924 RepID=A0A9P3H471_9FUNG|nr:hypothetical protein EMPS_02142 [Entomortierella parvispora]
MASSYNPRDPLASAISTPDQQSLSLASSTSSSSVSSVSSSLTPAVLDPIVFSLDCNDTTFRASETLPLSPRSPPTSAHSLSRSNLTGIRTMAPNPADTADTETALPRALFGEAVSSSSLSSPASSLPLSTFPSASIAPTSDPTSRTTLVPSTVAQSHDEGERPVHFGQGLPTASSTTRTTATTTKTNNTGHDPPDHEQHQHWPSQVDGPSEHFPDQEEQEQDLHSQFQLQAYIEDLEQEEAAIEDSLQVEAAVQASLIQLDNNPAHDHHHLPTWSTSVFDQQNLAEDVNMLAHMSSQLHLTGHGGHDTNLTQALLNTAVNSSEAGGGGGGLLRDIAGGFDDDEYNDDDDDEECPPPSETKYFFYDDPVPPVGIAEAVAELNGDLMDVLWKVNEAARDGFAAVDRYYWESSSALEMAGTSPPDVGTQGGEESVFSQIQQDYLYREKLKAKKEPPTAAATAQEEALRWWPRDKFPGAGTGSLSLSPRSEDEPLYPDCDDADDFQGRLSHHAGPDILINLAGNILSPISIHDLYFSRYYACLVHLNLWDTNLGTWGAQAVGGLMADSACRIQYLNLGRNHLGFEGIVQLWGIYKNRSLVELDLRENGLGQKEAHTLQQIMVRPETEKPCNIRRLDLRDNVINDVGCLSIAKIIQCTVLSHLDLSGNRISDWGASTILAAFETNELPLRDINLGANPLSFAGGVDICKILALPRSRITHLDLRGAKLTDVGIPYVAEALRSHHCPIVSLNLYDCQLTDTGIVKMALVLSVNKSLRVLGLGCNCIGDLGIVTLSHGLRLNNTLQELDVSQNDTPLSRAGVEELMVTMRSNTTLLHLRVGEDGHSHELTGNNNDGHGGFGEHEADFQYLFQQPLLPSHHPLGLSWTDQQQAATGLSTPTPPLPTPTIIGEVMAPTHAAVAQPLQVPPLPLPMSTINHPASTTMVPAVIQTTAMEPIQGLFPQLLPNGGAGAAVPVTVATGGAGPHEGLTEQDAERERVRLSLALSSLKTYVRHNYRRVNKLHCLCFEILVTARVLLFAKDVVRAQSMETGSALGGEGKGFELDILSSRSQSPNEGSALVPLHSGLPTPPSSGSEGAWPLLDSISLVKSGDPTSVMAPRKPCGTLAGLPWEVKEMILRRLDRKGLMSERQFQTVMNYGGSSWETKREPWEKWGEIREIVLEKTRCYYYEP